MSAYVCTSDTSPETPPQLPFLAWMHPPHPNCRPTSPQRRSSRLNPLHCSFGQLLTELETICAPGLQLPICTTLSFTHREALMGRRKCILLMLTHSEFCCVRAGDRMLPNKDLGMLFGMMDCVKAVPFKMYLLHLRTALIFYRHDAEHAAHSMNHHRVHGGQPAAGRPGRRTSLDHSAW